jgi:hypothetical protein
VVDFRLVDRDPAKTANTQGPWRFIRHPCLFAFVWNCWQNFLRSIDARREATGDQGIGSAVERDILDRELAELALGWMMNPQSPRVPRLSRIR